MCSKLPKLTYFNIPGLAEPTRIIFHYVNVPFEDVRIEFKDWGVEKGKQPWGQVPVYEEDGKILCQSFAITRYVGNKFGLNGKDEFEDAKIDEYMDSLKDLYSQLSEYFRYKDPEKIKSIKDRVRIEEVPKFLPKFEKDLQMREFLVGDKLTWGDIVLAHYGEMFGQLLNAPTLLDTYPNIKEHGKRIFAIPRVAEYIRSRPLPQH